MVCQSASAGCLVAWSTTPSTSTMKTTKLTPKAYFITEHEARRPPHSDAEFVWYIKAGKPAGGVSSVTSASFETCE